MRIKELTISGLKRNIDKELRSFIDIANKEYGLSSSSPELYRAVKEFVLRDGKRIRPVLVVLGYLAFKKRIPKNLYRCALSIELLHDFMLVHDDIMDKSDLRRGKPALHKVFEKELSPLKNRNFRGEDLGIIAGDVMYSLAMKAFRSFDAGQEPKEKALDLFIDAATYTASGQFIEFMKMTKPLGKITKKDIYRIYDYKTSIYTFSCPLAMGASLSGASEKDVEKLSGFGLNAGRAFQIKDDIIGTYGDEEKTGKSAVSDLEEGKRTILLYEAYRRGSGKEKKTLDAFLIKKNKTKKDIRMVKEIILKTGSLEYAKKEIARFMLKSKGLLRAGPIRTPVKQLLFSYMEKILEI